MLGGDDKFVWCIGGMVMYRSRQKFLERSCPSATLSIKNFAWTTLGLNSGLYTVCLFAFYRTLVITSAGGAVCSRFKSRHGVTALVSWISTLNEAATASLYIMCDYLFTELPVVARYVM